MMHETVAATRTLQRSAPEVRPYGSLPSVRPTRIIVYAWGEKYIGELLSLTLPALLAPGNLPYVAATVPCEVVILTEEAAFPRFLGDHGVRKIQELCPVRLTGLDDLIPSPDKYGMALTYVLHRGFSDLGPSVTDTWLLFLNADFIIADGSLRNLVRHLADGKRLVASPSYCVNAEAVVPELLKRLDPHTRQLALSPRDMASLVLAHRHNTIRGKTVNQPVFSMRYMDQFYWLVDNNTLVGHQMPVAIVGMRPERYLPEPNSYWDHGLIKEFLPTTDPCVIGDSDEFLMLELRGEQVAQEQGRVGWPDPSEIARNMTSFMTAYQRGMARYPLTLHAADLPATVTKAREKLQAFVDVVLAHLPAVLPSHIDHPQWNYHRSGFVEARYKYLSARLGSRTATEEPPSSLNEVDRTWWKLDGLTKSHERLRDDLVDRMSYVNTAVAQVLALLKQDTESRRPDAYERLMRELDAVQGNPSGEQNEFSRFVQLMPQQAYTGSADPPDHPKDPHVLALLRSAEEWTAHEHQMNEKSAWIEKANELVTRHYKDRLLLLESEFESARRQLQFEYDRLTVMPLASATIPHITFHQGPLAALPPSWTGETVAGGTPASTAAPLRNLLFQLGRHVHRRYYGKLPRVHLLHPYWASMRHLIKIVDTVSDAGAANVLIVSGGGAIADSAADHFPGLHASASLQEVAGGNLIKAFSESIQFDLCICTPGLAELDRMTEAVKAVTPCMRPGGKIVGFCPNFELAPVSINELNALRRLFESAPSGRVYFAGSEKSAQAVQRSGVGSTRFSGVVGIARLLFIVGPRALAANKHEAAASDEQSVQVPTPCTSITIEITV
jgi:hypothetical protein